MECARCVCVCVLQCENHGYNISPQFMYGVYAVLLCAPNMYRRLSVPQPQFYTEHLLYTVCSAAMSARWPTPCPACLCIWLKSNFGCYCVAPFRCCLLGMCSRPVCLLNGVGVAGLVASVVVTCMLAASWRLSAGFVRMCLCVLVCISIEQCSPRARERFRMLIIEAAFYAGWKGQGRAALRCVVDFGGLRVSNEYKRDRTSGKIL